MTDISHSCSVQLNPRVGCATIAQCRFIFGPAAKILKHGRGKRRFANRQIVYRQAGIRARAVLLCIVFLEQSNRFRCKNPAQVLQASKLTH